MGEGFQFLDIILFALVAGFLIVRLRSVLGRRDGHQTRTPDPFRAQPEASKGEDKVVRLPDRGERPLEAVAATGADTPEAPGVKGSLEAGLTQIAVADPKFDQAGFVSGARIAFELVLNAFAAGDDAAMQPLLSPEVFGNFADAIHQRKAAGQRLETKLVALKAADLEEAYMAGRTAHVSVKFVSEQISALYDAEGRVIEGDPTSVVEVTDYWTFARDTRAADPNWALVATDTPA